MIDSRFFFEKDKIVGFYQEKNKQKYPFLSISSIAISNIETKKQGDQQKKPKYLLKIKSPICSSPKLTYDLVILKMILFILFHLK